MAKKLTIYGIVVFLVVGLAIYIFRRASGKRSIDTEDNVAVAEFEDFRFVRSDLMAPLLQISADQSFLYGGGRIMLTGNVQGFRVGPGGIEEKMRAENVQMWGRSSERNKLFAGKEVKLEKGIAETNVILFRNDHEFLTEMLEYDGTENKLSSDRSVEGRGPGRSFHGANGMILDLDTNDLEIRGPVRGRYQTRRVN